MRHSLHFRVISFLASASLLTSSLAPAIAAAQEGKKPHHPVPRPTFKPMKGVPLFDLTKGGAPAKRASFAALTKLDEIAHWKADAESTDPAAWHKEAAAIATSITVKADDDIWLGEYALAKQENPKGAEKLFDKAMEVAPRSSQEHYVAAYDHALSSFFQGEYAQTFGEIGHIMKSRPVGLDRKDIVWLYIHSRACAGYHAQRSAMGITEPTKVDPLCAAASLAVCLRELGMNYSRAKVLASVRHTGEGSNLQDIIDAAPKLGLTAVPVATGNPKKFKTLPMPLVAHVEHDHFIAVLRTDKAGVVYNCSDCGVWPGGFKHVTWKQWKAMEADAYAVLARKGSPLDLALASYIPGTRGDVKSAVAGGGFAPRAVVAAERAASVVESMRCDWLGYYLFATVECGFKLNDPRCPDCNCNELEVELCPWVLGGGGFPCGTNDPLNLSTGEEEYHAPTDLHIYNPVGPAVHFQRVYDSLRSDGSPFGPGWSHPYNVSIPYDTEGGGLLASTGSKGSCQTTLDDFGGNVVLANGANIPFSWPTGASALSDTHLSQVMTVPVGYPVIVTVHLHIHTTTTYVTVEFPDRTVWTTADSTSNTPYAVTQMTDRNGNSLSLHYGGYTVGGVTKYILDTIYNSASTALLSLTVDTNGRYTEAEDCYGRVVHYNYDSSSNDIYQVSQLATSTDGDPPVGAQYTYSNLGNGEDSSGYYYLHTISIPSATGSGMATATINYDSFYGLVTSLVDANGNTITLSSGGENVTKVTYANSSSTSEYQYSVGYDSNMDWTSLLNASGDTVVSRTYADANDPYRPSSISDGLSHTWNLTWDPFGHMETLETPKSTTTTNTWSYGSFALGELTSTVTGSKTSTEFTYYEPSGLVHTVDAPIPGNSGSSSRQTTTYSYTSLGNIDTITSPGNNATTNHTMTYGYTSDGGYSQNEAIGEPITVTDSLSKVTHLRYDSQGNLTSETDANSNEWQAEYNIANQLDEVIVPATGNTGTGNATQTATILYPGGPTTTVTAYDESGASARTVSYTYGFEGEPLSVSGDAETTSVTYGSPYWIKTLTDGNSHTTTYSHGTTSVPLSGDMTEVSYPNASSGYDTVTYAYNVMHEATERVDGNGVETDYGYSDGDGLLNSISYPASTSLNVGVTYDGYDRAHVVSDGTGSLTNTFDDLDGVTQSVRSYTGLSNQTLSYSYYPDGSRSELDTPAGDLTYDYDADGRYTSMVSPVGTSYAAYQDNGWQSSRTLPNSIATSYSYNAAGAISSLVSTHSGGTVSSFASCTYDGVFNLTGFVGTYGAGLTWPNGNRTFTYDSKDRLTQDQLEYTSGNPVTQTFAYDSAGNATTFIGASKSYNNDNQLSGTGFAFDGNGNPTTYASASLSYDPENRLTGVGSTLSATYRADGLRASKTTSAGTTYFLYDQGNPIVELNSSGTVTAFNIFAPDGLVARTASGATTEYVLDQQGNVVNRTNTSGANVSVTQYDAYGTEHTAYGSPSDPFAYNGQWGYYLDRETGLYNCQHRYYDPGIGRWLNRDPIGFAGGTNLYGYCAGGPVDEADAEGTGWPQVLGLSILDPVDTGWAELLALTGKVNSDAEGQYYVTGGLVSRLNPRGNAITFGGFTFINPSDEPQYIDNSQWRGHEHWHNVQNALLGPFYFPATIHSYCTGFVDEVLFGPPSANGPTGHDHAPLEIDADNHNGSGRYGDPLAPIMRTLLLPLTLPLIGLN